MSAFDPKQTFRPDEQSQTARYLRNRPRKAVEPQPQFGQIWAAVNERAEHVAFAAAEHSTKLRD